MSAAAGAIDARRCFACGPDNPIGLKIRFRLDGDVCRGEFKPGPDHTGFEGTTHGGILYSALDDAMANWLYLRGVSAHTARCEVRYRGVLASGSAVRLESRLLRMKGRFAILEARATRTHDGALVAESRGTFHVFDDGRGGLR